MKLEFLPRALWRNIWNIASLCLYTQNLFTNFLWTSYGLLMNFLWTSYELLMNFSWIMNFLWTSYKLRENFLQTSWKHLTNFLQMSLNILKTSYKLLSNLLWASLEHLLNFWTFCVLLINFSRTSYRFIMANTFIGATFPRFRSQLLRLQFVAKS